MSSDEIVELDRPCQYCKVLILNDANQGGTVKHTKEGARYVDFGTVTETHRARSGPLSRAGWGDVDDLKEFPKINLKLDYKREDSLPHMPGFLVTASEGCSFCSLLRDDIIRAWLSKKKGLEKYHNDSVEIPSAELSVTEICYRLDENLEYRLKELAENDIGLNSLYVFFTVRWEKGAIEYSLAYDVYTHATGTLEVCRICSYTLLLMMLVQTHVNPGCSADACR